jgi:hypothetical protein
MVRSGEHYTIYQAWGRRGGSEVNMDAEPQEAGASNNPTPCDWEQRSILEAFVESIRG